MQFYRVDELVRAFTDDLSPRGAFVHTDAWLPINGVVDLCVLLSERDSLVVPARVAYCLPPDQASVLGRRPGIGFQFLPSPHARLEPLERYVRRMSSLVPDQRSAPRARVLVGCASDRLRRRLLHTLSQGPFELSVVSSGVELYGRARATAWDAIVVDESIDALRWLSSLVRSVQCGAAPVLYVSGDHDQITRLAAYRAGATDFLPRPFTDEELSLRVERLARRAPETGRADISGDLARMPLSSVLTLLELEQRSGLLTLQGDEDSVQIALYAGAIASIDGRNDADARARLLDVLQWMRGSFAFHTAAVAQLDSEPWPIAGVLLHSAKLADERRVPALPRAQAPRRRTSTPI